jgi:conjugal transfer pilus assembly protein TraB
MSDKPFSSANKAISVAGGGKSAASGLNAKSMLTGMTKDVKKRWTMVGIVSVILITGVSTWMSSGNTRPVPKEKEVASIDTTPRGMNSQKDWKAQTGAEMAAVRLQLEATQKSQREIALTLNALRDEMKTKGSTPVSAQPSAPVGPGLNLPPPPEPPKTLMPVMSSAPTTTGAPGAPGAVPTQDAAPAPVAPAPKRSAARAFIPVSAVKAEEAEASTEAEEMQINDRRGFLPAGSFAKASLISGVEAFTGGTAQSQPQPMVIRLDANAILPNSAGYDIKGCHVLASVWGDMSSERVFGRTATLTCVDSKNRLVLSEEVEGTLIDSDGKNGIRGSLQDRQGAKLARSLLAGFAEGMSTALGAAQSTVTATGLGSVTSVDPSKMFQSASYGGASEAANQLSEFYLKQAEGTLPIIAVDAGRRISVLFTKSKALKFETIDTYRVKPKEKLHVVRGLN